MSFYHIWLARCLPRWFQTLWSGPPALLAPRWTSAPAQCGSGGRGTASLCSSHWRPWPGPHTPQIARWRRPQSIQSRFRHRFPRRQLPYHSLDKWVDFRLAFTLQRLCDCSPRCWSRFWVVKHLISAAGCDEDDEDFGDRPIINHPETEAWAARHLH